VPEERCILVLDATEWGGDTFIAQTWPATRRGLERAGSISAEDLARFDAELEESAASGAFYWSVVRHAWRARKP
jgi:hypothetical protein